MPANNLSGAHAHRVQTQRGLERPCLGRRLQCVQRATYPARPSVEHHLAHPQDGNRISDTISPALCSCHSILRLKPLGPPASAPAYRAKTSSAVAARIRTRGLSFSSLKNFSGEGRWITARHKHRDFPLDMFDALSKRLRRFFVNTQRGIDLQPAIRRITRLNRP